MLGRQVMIGEPLFNGINNRVEQGKEEGDQGYFYALKSEIRISDKDYHFWCSRLYWR